MSYPNTIPLRTFTLVNWYFDPGALPSLVRLGPKQALSAVQMMPGPTSLLWTAANGSMGEPKPAGMVGAAGAIAIGPTVGGVGSAAGMTVGGEGEDGRRDGGGGCRRGRGGGHDRAAARCECQATTAANPTFTPTPIGQIKRLRARAS